MKIGVIGVDLDRLGKEYQYYGPYNDALNSRFEDLIEELDITAGISGATPGAETIFTWLILGRSMHMTTVVPCTEYTEGWAICDQDTYRNIIKCSNDVLTLGKGPLTDNKESFRDERIIDRADIMIVVWDMKGVGRMSKALEYIKKSRKEIILINTNELLYEANSTEKNTKESSKSI